MPTIEPFTVAFPDAALEDLKQRLGAVRWAEDFANDDWRYGVNGDYLKEIVEYWRTTYDWRAAEAEMNSFANYKVEMDGIPIHFIHERGKGPDPIPLIINHGYVPNHWDYRDVIRPLADPAAYGGDPADAFHVVVPSLPGFGFSSPLTKPGVSVRTTTDLWYRLMHDLLGYERFGVQGCDWGSWLTAQIGHKYPEAVIGVHMNMPVLLGKAITDFGPEDYAPEEAGWYEHVRSNMRVGQIHQVNNRNEPQTLGYALADSPVGLAAWILQRRRNFGDTRGNIERRLSKDRLLTGIMIYWLTNSFTTAMRYYWEDFRDPWQPVHPGPKTLTVPTGYAMFAAEAVRIPRAAAEKETNLVHWSELPAGGHFAAAEEPEMFVAEVRDFFRKVRRS